MIEQLSLFDEIKWCDVGIKILDILNDSNTIWKNSLIISQEKYEAWVHVKHKLKTYSITIKDTKEKEPKRNFVYYDNNKEEAQKLNDYMFEKIGKILGDKIEMSFSPNLIHIWFIQCENDDPSEVYNKL